MTVTSTLLVSIVGWSAIQLLDPVEQDAVDCSSLEAATFADADSLARACNADVEVVAERTPWQTTWATADGQSRLDVSSIASRVQVDGEWKPMDTSLVADPKGGTVKVAAPVYPIELSAGDGSQGAPAAGPAFVHGASTLGFAATALAVEQSLGIDPDTRQPLGTITRDDMQLQVWFPLELPTPRLSDSQAVYEIAQGIRLVVSVNPDGTGFTPVVELANPGAAARFAAMLDAARGDGDVSQGSELEFATSVSEGLTLSVDEDNAVHVTDGAGETQFFAPPPLMWDSSGGSVEPGELATEVAVTDRTRSPADGDQITGMDVKAAGETVVVVPDDAILESPDTVWPVYIDPGWSGLTQSYRVAVRTGGYADTLHNWGNISSTSLGQGTGRCNSLPSCVVVFTQRLAWQFSGLTGLRDLAGSDITSASFFADGTHSANCTNQTTTLVRTSTLTTGTTWSNLSWGLGWYGARTEYHSQSCGNLGTKEFNALDAAKWAADNDQSTLSLGLAVDESSITYWKRFGMAVSLSVNFNRPPDTPSSLMLTSPWVQGCTTGSARPVIATTTPTLSAVSTDLDATTLVQTSFVVASASNLTDVKWNSGYLAGMASGSRRNATVPAASGLVDGGVYAWRARAFDGAKESTAWSAWCEFAVDISAPAKPTVTPVTSGVQAIYVENAERGGIGQEGKFLLDRNGSTGEVAFVYGFNNPNSQLYVIADAGGSAVISYTPTTTGPVTLTVKAFDAAYNVSDTKTYVFDVATPTEDGIWTFDEGEGATAADSAGNPPRRPMSLAGGAMWGDGPHALFDSRDGDHALALDGVNDSAATDASVVDTLGSFVVSAHVWLDPSRVGQGQSFAALSQDGATQSGFQLGYTGSCAGTPNGCWSFTMPDALSGAASTSTQSDVRVNGGEWVYLVGEHDATDHKLRLWVCEIGTPTDPEVGEPVKSEVPRTTAPWEAAGAFVAGRGLSSGAGSRWWPGAIDNVRVFSGEVLAESESKIRRLCQGAEPRDFGGDASELDPTIEVAP